jgi:hypothetical protein
MTKAREIMTPDATCLSASDTVLDAAKLMAEHDVGALPKWNPGADPAPESDDGPVPPDDFTAETSVAG